MHRLHCGSNKVRRGSWPPQVSFVSRLLPPSEWPWPWATRPTAVWWAWWAASGWRAPARPARRRHSNAPYWLLRSSAESWETMPYQPLYSQQLEAWRGGPALQPAGTGGWGAGQYSRMNRHRPKALVSRSWPCSAARRWPWIAPLQTLCYILRG